MPRGAEFAAVCNTSAGSVERLSLRDSWSVPSVDKDEQAAIATTRFGLGARRGELAMARSAPRDWLLAQISEGDYGKPATIGPSSTERLETYIKLQANLLSARKRGDMGEVRRLESLRDDVGREDFLRRTVSFAKSPSSFRDRWNLFWANHFTVSSSRQITSVLAGPFETEAIRPNSLGSFADLLIAAATHPAMITYLDQAVSIGPNSRAAATSKRGLNENLARELLELHTVGLEARYSQADVLDLAKALTGWSIAEGPLNAHRHGYAFLSDNHEPGARRVLGSHYRAGGEEQALSIMKDLAKRPETAKRCAWKIASHFVADTPPVSVVADIERTWRATDGDLKEVASALIRSTAAWDARAFKFKSPYEFIVSAYRAIGTSPTSIFQVSPYLEELGQPYFRPPSPEGWSDDSATWFTSDAIWKRMRFSQDFAFRYKEITDVSTVAQDCLGVRMSQELSEVVAKIDNPQLSLAALLMSPEFQRR